MLLTDHRFDHDRDCGTNFRSTQSVAAWMDQRTTVRPVGLARTSQSTSPNSLCRSVAVPLASPCLASQGMFVSGILMTSMSSSMAVTNTYSTGCKHPSTYCPFWVSVSSLLLKCASSVYSGTRLKR